MYELTVEDTFDAAHCIRGYRGKCDRLHGHTYRVSVTVQAAELDEAGIGVDFRKLKGALKNVISELDHQYLNDLPAFADINPSAENIARHAYKALAASLGMPIFKVTVWESPTSAASYSEL